MGWKSELEDNSRPPIELTADKDAKELTADKDAKELTADKDAKELTADKDAKELPSDREPVELPGSPSLSVSAVRPKTPGTVSSAGVPTPHDI